MVRKYQNRQHLLLTTRENGRVKTLVDEMVTPAVHRKVMRFVGSKAELTKVEVEQIKGMIDRK